MTEHVTPLDLAVTWDPNGEEMILLRDESRVALAVGYGIDSDHRNVVFEWRHVRHLQSGSPNDEAISGHRLYRSGLSAMGRSGTVSESSLIASLERANRVHRYHDPARFSALTHFIILLKGGVVEVVAESLAVHRLDGTLLSSAAGALDLT
jgi:hypothetical protein